MRPAPYFELGDVPERVGLSEIFHYMGLYRLWATLLEENPTLMIDNCASGGRRIDIETMRLSVPLWRSDYQCSANFDVDVCQSQMPGFSSYLPYHSTGMGRIVDLYRARSCYSSGLGTNFWFSDKENFENTTAEEIRLLRQFYREEKRCRPYFSEDFYPLSGVGIDKTAWCAFAFDRPEQGDGLLMVFRREESYLTDAVYRLPHLSGTYLLEDFDGGETEVTMPDIPVHIEKPYTAKLFIYHKK
ncbi:MAG: alpha-galactosidase [Clostridia bacterium]|nr:alpha-galactosidase [Clostridia bacterium]